MLKASELTLSKVEKEKIASHCWYCSMLVISSLVILFLILVQYILAYKPSCIQADPIPAAEHLAKISDSLVSR